MPVAMPALPIVIVPGIMGSRLAEPGGLMVWDPYPGLSARARLTRLANPAPLVPVVAMDNVSRVAGRLTPGERLVAPTVRGLGGIVFEVGGRLALDLAYSPAFRGALASRSGRVPEVSVAGYDWRQTCAASAVRLQTVVTEAVQRTGADQVILVAHSMGGLVSRWFCRYGAVAGRPAASVVAGLVLIGSPTYGASKAYRMLKLWGGAAREAELEWELEGPDPFFRELAAGGGRDLVRTMRAVYELLPNERWCALRPNWLRFDTAKAGFADASDPVRLYASPYTGFLDTRAARGAGVAAHLAGRAGFHRALGSYMPPRTALIYSTDVTTEADFRLVETLRGYGPFRLERPSHDLGDGTVPLTSAAAAGTTVAARVPLTGGIGHTDLPDHPSVRAAVKAAVLATPVGPPTAPPTRVPELSF